MSDLIYVLLYFVIMQTICNDTHICINVKDIFQFLKIYEMTRIEIRLDAYILNPYFWILIENRKKKSHDV